MFFSYDPKGNFELHDTEDEAEAAADEAVDDNRTYCDKGWDEETDGICYGIVLAKAAVVSRMSACIHHECDPADGPHTHEFDEYLDYGLVAQPYLSQFNERNKKLHRRAQRAEARAAHAEHNVPWEKVERWNTELFSKLRHELSLERARADAAEARLELLLVERD